jgi:hypothetical protein
MQSSRNKEASQPPIDMVAHQLLSLDRYDKIRSLAGLATEINYFSFRLTVDDQLIYSIVVG